MGIAIITKFRGPTNTQGSRYSASAGGKPGGGVDRLTKPSNHALNPLQNRAIVARALAVKLEWRGLWIAGGLDGNDVVFVNVPVAADKAATMRAMMNDGFEGEDWFYLPEEDAGDSTAIKVEEFGYVVRTYDSFMNGAVDMTGFADASAMSETEKRARHDEIREALRARAAEFDGTHVLYDPSGDGEGWLLVGSEAEIIAETVEMIRANYLQN